MNHGDNLEGAPPAEEAAPRGRLRWAGAVFVASMLGGGAWLAVQAWQPPAAAGGGLERGALADPARAKARPGMNEVRLAPQGAAARAAEPFAERPAEPAAGGVEVCGLGRVAADAAGRPLDMAPIREAGKRLRAQVLPSLLRRADDTLRAAGLLMIALEGGADDAAAAAPGGVGSGAQRARDELASLAAFKGTPLVYAWALRACQPQRQAGVCRMLSAEQWARLEPANAMAWLQVAADARLRHDDAGVAEAMYRVSQAARSDARRGSLASTVLSGLPPDADLLSRVALAADLARLEVQAELPLVAASQYCGAREVRDANRQQVCAEVALLLTRHGSTPAEAALGTSIGERVGWAPERVAAGGEELDALAQLNAEAPAGDAWSCSAMAQALSRLHETAHQGELATLREALRRSPQSTTVLAQRHRDAMATRVASAASAASATSP